MMPGNVSARVYGIEHIARHQLTPSFLQNLQVEILNDMRINAHDILLNGKNEFQSDK